MGSWYIILHKNKLAKASNYRVMNHKTTKTLYLSGTLQKINEHLKTIFLKGNIFSHFSSIVFQAHKTVRLTKNHSVFSLVELRSGKVSLLKKKSIEDDHCKEHPGQVLWFYCKRCDVPICRDCTVVEHPSGSHELVKIDEAITGQREEIQKLTETCKIVEKEVAEAFQQLHSMQEHLESTCEAVNMAIDKKKDKVKQLLLADLEKQTEDLKKTVAGMRSARDKAASTHKDELQMLSFRLKTAAEMASQVTSEGSDCDVASVYKHLTTTLKQLGQITPPSIDLGKIRFLEESSLKTSVGCLGKIDETEITHQTGRRSSRMRNKKQWNAPWKMVKKIGDTGNVKLTGARGVAINQDGDVAVADYGAKRVYVYSIEDGEMKLAIDTTKSLHSNPSDYGSYPHGVAVYQRNYIVTDGAHFPTVYDNKENYVREILITKNTKSNTMGIAVNSQGHVLVGHYSATSLEVHSVTDGNYINSLEIPVPGHYIAVSSSTDGKIIISANDSAGAQVIDSQGQTIHVLRPPTDVTSAWSPSGVCTIGEGDDEEIFVCNCEGKRGVYRFSLKIGKYLGCVTTEVIYPQGIAFTEDERLVVADRNCVKVFAPAE